MIGSFKCQRCKHNYNPDEKNGDWKCDAFPEGIPEEKLMRITRDPCIDCNNGIAFDSLYDSENIMKIIRSMLNVIRHTPDGLYL